MLSRLVITFLPRSKHLLISWLQSPSAVILESPKMKSATISTYLPWCNGTRCHDLSFLNVEFKPTFSLSSFTFIKGLFGSLVSAIRVVSSAYLRLLVFLPAILIPACASSSPGFLMMHSAYKLNKQGDNIQPWCTPFPIWNQSVFPCPVLTVASWSVYRFSQEAAQVFWYSHLFQNFPQFVVIHTVKGFGTVNKAEVNVFLELSCFSMIQWMLAVWSLFPLPFLNPAWASGSSLFMYCWSSAWRILSITFTNVWDECNCVVVRTFFGIAFLWDWNENWPFPVPWPLLSFPSLLAYWVRHFHSIIF